MLVRKWSTGHVCLDDHKACNGWRKITFIAVILEEQRTRLKRYGFYRRSKVDYIRQQKLSILGHHKLINNSGKRNNYVV